MTYNKLSLNLTKSKPDVFFLIYSKKDYNKKVRAEILQ
ncbi:hypothetical protein CUZ89_1042 [Enterococcus xinjiangensis]|nr:hypothetical protein [Enterococcus lactis]MBL4991214.1 hypothetical protein [Enterococcus lactis]MBL5002861.1 hypothetical protein [Enterococcus lactis]